MRNLKRFIVIAIFGTASILLAQSQRSLLEEEFSEPDFSFPPNISSHVINFFHHSCGTGLLNNGLADGFESLGYNLHSRIMTDYEYENTSTDYRHWYKRFQRELGIRVGDNYYLYEGPDEEGNPITGEQIDDDYRDFMLNYYEFNAERMDIIMFKPCYPNSQISNLDTQFGEELGNNGYGTVMSGTPYSDNGNNNFLYLNSSSSVTERYDDIYWENGLWSAASSSLAQIKCVYRGLLNVFVENPDILFIAMQAPPLADLTNDQAANCRELARWMREDWLHQYDPTGTDQFEDYPEKNVVPFDFQNSVGWTSNDSLLDSDYFWFIRDGFPDNTLDTDNLNSIGEGASGRDHPASWLNQRTAAIFCGGTDIYSNQYTGQPARTYDCWINAVVNRWESQQALPVELIGFSGLASANSVTLTWSTTTEKNNFGFDIERTSDQYNFEKIEFIQGHNTTTSRKNYQYIDENLTQGHYYYRLKQIDFDGNFTYSEVIEVQVVVVGVIKLNQNYPNPFNSSTSISYELSKDEKVEISIYNINGQEVLNLVSMYLPAGFHTVEWEGNDYFGNSVPTGVYYCQLKTINDTRNLKILYLK